MAGVALSAIMPTQRRACEGAGRARMRPNSIRPMRLSASMTSTPRRMCSGGLAAELYRNQKYAKISEAMTSRTIACSCSLSARLRRRFDSQLDRTFTRSAFGQLPAALGGAKVRQTVITSLSFAKRMRTRSGSNSLPECARIHSIAAVRLTRCR